MKQEFIPYEQALELKELGFDEPCSGYYHEDKSLTYTNMVSQNTNSFWKINNKVITAPLYQQAFKWFRDKKLSDASINRHGEADGGYSYRWEIVYEYGVYEERHFKMGYNTYEEAELACLNKLIEIVKQPKKD
jgi:hypothetical protein